MGGARGSRGGAETGEGGVGFRTLPLGGTRSSTQARVTLKKEVLEVF